MVDCRMPKIGFMRTVRLDQRAAMTPKWSRKFKQNQTQKPKKQIQKQNRAPAAAPAQSGVTRYVVSLDPAVKNGGWAIVTKTAGRLARCVSVGRFNLQRKVDGSATLAAGQQYQWVPAEVIAECDTVLAKVPTGADVTVLLENQHEASDPVKHVFGALKQHFGTKLGADRVLTVHAQVKATRFRYELLEGDPSASQQYLQRKKMSVVRARQWIKAQPAGNVPYDVVTTLNGENTREKTLYDLSDALMMALAHVFDAADAALMGRCCAMPKSDAERKRKSRERLKEADQAGVVKPTVAKKPRRSRAAYTSTKVPTAGSGAEGDPIDLT